MIASPAGEFLPSWAVRTQLYHLTAGPDGCTATAGATGISRSRPTSPASAWCAWPTSRWYRPVRSPSRWTSPAASGSPCTRCRSGLRRCATAPRLGRVEYRQPVVMGVLNVTPDSFSDGGRYAGLEAAVAHGVRMFEEGAQLVDVGGESTRPGADRVDPDTEAARVLPVIRELASAGVPMSIDTTRASVAAAALDAGVQVVNDVSGGLADARMAKVVADRGCPWVLMHWR